MNPIEIIGLKTDPNTGKLLAECNDLLEYETTPLAALVSSAYAYPGVVCVELTAGFYFDSSNHRQDRIDQRDGCSLIRGGVCNIETLLAVDFDVIIGKLGKQSTLRESVGDKFIEDIQALKDAGYDHIEWCCIA